MKEMRIFLAIILYTLAVLIATYVLPGVFVNNVWTALVVAVFLSFLNRVVRPLIFILTLPINILTLGLFSFLIMGLLVYPLSAIIPGFAVKNFGWAILFSLIVTAINWFLWRFIPPRKR